MVLSKVNRTLCLVLNYINILLQDEFASLPPIIPNGPVAIYGLVRNYAMYLIRI